MNIVEGEEKVAVGTDTCNSSILLVGDEQAVLFRILNLEDYILQLQKQKSYMQMIKVMMMVTM